MKKLKIAMCQIKPIIGDFGGNIIKIEEKLAKAKNNNADIAVFPEIAISGYFCKDLFHSKDFLEENEKAINKITNISKNFDFHIIIGAATKNKECTDKFSYRKIFNSALILLKGKIIEIYHKRAMANYPPCQDSRYFKKGNKESILNIHENSIGILICEDVWTKEIQDLTFNKKLDHLIVLNSSPYFYGKIQKRFKLIQNLAKTNHCNITYVNDVGCFDGILTDGSSFSISKKGQLLEQCDKFKEDYKIINFSESISNDKKEKLATIEKNNFKVNDNERLKEIWGSLKFGLLEYVNTNNFDGVVIGMSGGIDSAISAAIARDCLEHEKVKLILMPSKYTSDESIKDAENCADLLKCKLINISIDNLFSEYEKSFNNKIKNYQRGTTLENIQARIRGNIIMASSNSENLLAISTGNKSELSVGYGTLYGDMAGGFNIIKNIYKTDIYKLAIYRNQISKVIPENIINKEPTAELKENQKDSDNLPDYDVLDEVLKKLIDDFENLENIDNINVDNINFDRETIYKIYKLLNQAQHKRYQSPFGIQISQKNLEDYLLPVCQKYLQYKLKKQKI